MKSFLQAKVSGGVEIGGLGKAVLHTRIHVRAEKTTSGPISVNLRGKRHQRHIKKNPPDAILIEYKIVVKRPLGKDMGGECCGKQYDCNQTEVFHNVYINLTCINVLQYFSGKVTFFFHSQKKRNFALEYQTLYNR